MQIQVLGTGCATCKNLFEITKKAVYELGLATEVEYITDLTKMIEMGIMTSPVLVVDGKIAMNGFTKDINQIKDLITENKEGSRTKDDKPQKSDGCDCESNCC